MTTAAIASDPMTPPETLARMVDLYPAEVALNPSTSVKTLIRGSLLRRHLRMVEQNAIWPLLWIEDPTVAARSWDQINIAWLQRVGDEFTSRIRAKYVAMFAERVLGLVAPFIRPIVELQIAAQRLCAVGLISANEMGDRSNYNYERFAQNQMGYAENGYTAAQEKISRLAGGAAFSQMPAQTAGQIIDAIVLARGQEAAWAERQWQADQVRSLVTAEPWLLQPLGIL